jgi:uncharacterized protein YkwD
MALVSMNARISPAAAPRLSMMRDRASMRLAAAILATAAVSWCVAYADTIPAMPDGSRTLVAVEPLLRSLQLPYSIDGAKLDVDGRHYPQALVVRGGADFVDAHAIAAFLHLRLTRQNGVLVFASQQVAAPTAPQPPSQADVDALRAQLLDALNEHRRLTGQRPLGTDPLAQEAAQYQAQDMAQAAAMRHADASGRSPMQRYEAMGGRAGWYAENVGWYGLDVSGHDAIWMALSKLDAQMMAEQPPDDGHRRNILSPQYEAVGIGISVAQSGLYLAEDFVGR